jgi:hypothetical protein
MAGELSVTHQLSYLGPSRLDLRLCGHVGHLPYHMCLFPIEDPRKWILTHSLGIGCHGGGCILGMNSYRSGALLPSLATTCPHRSLAWPRFGVGKSLLAIL